MGPGVRRDDDWEGATMRDEFIPCVYILWSSRHGTLYIGVTSNLLARLAQHREGLIPGFTRRYGVKRLVYYEVFDTMEAAIVREKRLKEWRRAWKIELIEARNEHWDDLAIGLGLPPLTSPDRLGATK
jgi:putative endonuclease